MSAPPTGEQQRRRLGTYVLQVLGNGVHNVIGAFLSRLTCKQVWVAVRNPDTNAIAQAWWRRANKHRHAQPSPAQVPISWQPASQRQAQRGPHVHRVRAASPSLPGRYRTRHPDWTLCLKRAHAAYVTVAIPGANADAKAPAKSGKPCTAQLFDDHSEQSHTFTTVDICVSWAAPRRWACCSWLRREYARYSVTL